MGFGADQDNRCPARIGKRHFVVNPRVAFGIGRKSIRADIHDFSLPLGVNRRAAYDRPETRDRVRAADLWNGRGENQPLHPNANATVDQKNTFLKSSDGQIAPFPNCVAEPKRNHAVSPITINIEAGSHVPIAPRLCSHFPMFKPMRFRAKPNPRPASETMMKYELLVERCCHRFPPTNNALPAAKYKSPA